MSLFRWLFRKNNDTINCDENDDAISFQILGRLLLLGSAWNEISLEVLELSTFLSQLKFWFAKKLKMNLRIAPTERRFRKLSIPCKNSRCFQQMVQLFNIMRIMLLA